MIRACTARNLNRTIETTLSPQILMLEPSDSSEAKQFTKLAFELSERFDTPVLLRVTTRVCHSKSVVELEDRITREPIPYERNIAKYVATPANGKKLRRSWWTGLKPWRNIPIVPKSTEWNITTAKLALFRRCVRINMPKKYLDRMLRI